MLHSRGDSAQNRTSTSSIRLRARIQLRAFNILYHRGAIWYDFVARAAFGDDWAAWRSAAAQLIVGRQVLDLGCGTGALVAGLGRQGVPVIGVDRSDAMLDVARRRDVGSTHRLVRADASALPFRAHAFDSVVSTFPARFILEVDVAREIGRVLRPGGVIVVLAGGHLDRWRWWQAPRRLLLWLVYGRGRDGPKVGPPDVNLLEGGSFHGRWLEVFGPQGRGWVWLGRID
ncbi:MAG TPA: methyltransferase domain-containing protein [Thermomicrobiaceae bacterium]|nr:methyltransferase domain-containing protein [Thermomicrobiaceae bacterium]